MIWSEEAYQIDSCHFLLKCMMLRTSPTPSRKNHLRLVDRLRLQIVEQHLRLRFRVTLCQMLQTVQETLEGLQSYILRCQLHIYVARTVFLALVLNPYVSNADVAVQWNPAKEIQSPAKASDGILS